MGIKSGAKSIVKRVKGNKFSQAITTAKSMVPDIQNLPKQVLLDQFSNQMSLRQQEWTKKGSPITEEEMIAGVAKEWRLSKLVYERAGVTFEELVELGKEAIAHPENGVPLSKPMQWLVNKTGRNAICPCGSGKKYKKCCGKG